MEQIHERSNVAGHGVVEGKLEVVCFDHPRRLYQAVVSDAPKRTAPLSDTPDVENAPAAGLRLVGGRGCNDDHETANAATATLSD
jgi:hypothetical protein